ncbi:WG repeat-containing protein [Hymenobacter properus]|uniref:WG repeat-containing protein n=1 Tax=Hymenobacter properus TaxID=2791026 RepID=A0A931BHQ2_9BACT|nr:WG repeat-containing protein [Hymenobacter properus]MBF9144140.1 WG repeat-containing protein [Hymenobacter properus]MBR7722956.1 WG repeat-containing protein [Microvirga sp. SRT04]
MVHHFLASPFDDAARANQFAAVRAALQADSSLDTLLLGNLVLEDGAEPIDALVVRPHSLTLLVLVPAGGRLSVPALGYGLWQLAGNALSVAEAFDNPYEQFVQQKKAVAEWLQPRFGPAQANLAAISGIVLFAAPLDFAPDVAPALNDAPTGFALLSSPAELPRVLQTLASADINLGSGDIAEWAAEWAAFAAKPAAPTAPSGPPKPSAAVPAGGVLAQKARAFWNWLGAADVPDDPPYGTDPAAARREEKQRLERLRQQMQADVAAQLQALEAREAERERSIAQLKAQLAQAPPVAADATALVSRIGAETREKAALEAQMEASRAESAARNRELDAKIQQLSQLIERLNAQPQPAAAPADHSATSPAEPTTSTAAPNGTRRAPSAAFASAAASARHLAGGVGAKLGNQAGPRFRQLRVWSRRLPRLGLVAGVVALLGLGGWGLGHLGGSAPVPFQEKGRWGFADAKGQLVIPAQFSAAKPFQNGRAVVAKAGAYGFVNEDGEEAVAPAYDALNPYADGYARARVGDAYTFINEQGEEFDSYYFNALDFAEGHAAVLDHRGWHYISGPEEPANPVIFKEAYSFVDGLARVRLADGFTYITSDYLDDPSEGTAPFGRYQHADDFANGQARVTQNGHTFLINKRGEEIK